MVGVRFSPYELPARDRKERKPIIEKMRRERMNTSISQLRDLISETIKRNAAPMSRVDKADILEYAVIHLQELRQQLHTTSGSSREADTQSYDMGFKDCAREAVTFLSTNQLADHSTVTHFSNHLQTVFMSRRHPAIVGRSSGTSGPCLSTPVRHHNMTNGSSFPKQLIPECSPIQRYHKTTSPQVMTSFRIPEIDTSIGVVSFNAVMSVLNSTDSSNSDVSMRSKDSSSADNDSLCSNKFSKKLRFSTENVSPDLSLGTAECVYNEMRTSDDSENNHDYVYADVVSGVQRGVAEDSNTVVSNETISTELAPEAVSECVWRPW